MVTVLYSPTFEKTIRKMKDGLTRERLKVQIKKIVRNPGIGKPMRYSRKQTREVYAPPFRLSYCNDWHNDILVFLALYRKDDQ
jgi:mRNA-degrading endonuclease RelE of RelBE toxin-antitoxin system